MFLIEGADGKGYTPEEYADVVLDSEANYEEAKRLIAFALNVSCLGLEDDVFRNHLTNAFHAHYQKLEKAIAELGDDGGDSIDGVNPEGAE